MLRTLIDNLPDTIYVKDDCGRKVIANIADVRSIGALSEGNVLGKTDLQLFKDEIVAKRGYQDDLIVLQTGQPILNKEECFSENDNRVKWLQTSKIPVCDENGKVIQLLGIGHDITQRKAKDEAIQLLNLELKSQAENLMLLNEQLNVRKEQELEKALAQGKFEIASEVLHDIGNALVGFGSHLTRLTKLSGQDFTTPIQNLSAFLSAQSPKLTDLFGAAKSVALTDLAINLSANQQKYSAEIRSAVRELVHIISHVKEILNIQRQFVRGQEGKHERKPVNLLRLVEDCKAMLGANYERKEIEFVLTTELETYFFDGDATKIMQVLLNIQKNAIEAIPIHAKEKKICLVLKKTLNWIELELTDSGIGFDLATGEHLFERGFTTKENGTGLGLFNCRSIIESHNGSLTIASDGPQRGTTVLIQLPCNCQLISRGHRSSPNTFCRLPIEFYQTLMGKVTQNVLPFSNSLSTRISPR
ncbi:MAG: PAS domain-containing sensor histidine kinase [Bacteroidota bacterium]|nr:PAS domain-containing sensor histidine kinase [Bacteroidota bacterium]